MAKKSLLRNVPDEKKFYSRHGEIYSNLHELIEGLHKIPLHSFIQHANQEKNDFAKWVEDVFEDEKLAKDMKKTKNPVTMAKKVHKKLSKKR